LHNMHTHISYDANMLDLRICTSLSEISAEQWNALDASTHPFTSHAFLSGLEQHGCLIRRYGWQAEHLLFYQDEKLIAAVPGYRKTNSHGEFVFDHAWANAYARLGLNYFPKYLNAVPYSPITGPRLLISGTTNIADIITAIQTHCETEQHSSAHCNFLTEAQAECFDDSWLARGDVQFHWQNTLGWQSFDDFLGALKQKKRKNIRAERSSVNEAGIAFRIVNGHSASENDLATMHQLYCKTQIEKGNHPALTLELFKHLAEEMPEQLVIVLAEHQQHIIAGALCIRSKDTLYGRYWGCEHDITGLHFETCYYQGIDYCLREGLTRFEPGAQGEHKIARGFLPVLTHSRHYIREQNIREALRDWCKQERHWALDYREQVLKHSPFREA
jgi:uncharacterized protein